MKFLKFSLIKYMLLFKHINTERTEHHNPGKGYIREEIILSLRGHNLMCDAEPHHLIKYCMDLAGF